MAQDNWQALTKTGIGLLKSGQPHRALVQLKRAEQLAPNERDVMYWLASAYRMTGATDAAVSVFRQLLTSRADDIDASFGLAFVLREAGAPGEAATVLLNAAAQPDVNAEQLLQVTGFLRDSNQFAAAIEVCEKAATLQPEQADLYFKLGRLYQAVGEFDKASGLLRKALDIQPALGPAWTLLAQQQRFASEDDADYQRIRQAATRQISSEADMCVAFAFAKALDDLEQWPAAWQQYEKGNALAAKAVSWDQPGWQKFVEGTISKRVRPASPSSVSLRNAVFIVGMPRSGTTLLEQMLSRHPQIAGRGELNFLDHFVSQVAGPLSSEQQQQIADVIWTQMRLDGDEGGYYIDKNPLNFRYLDTLFDVLPTARVLHLTRDGRDTTLSCYFQLFQANATAFSNSLEQLEVFYKGYKRLMTHWETTYPERICRVDYADLIEQAPNALANILEFLELPWDDIVTQQQPQQTPVRTASVWQARQPVHSRSLQRWRHYAQQAPEFFNRIAAIDKQYNPPHT